MNNYSFETSLPAYQERPTEKRRQCDNILQFIKRGVDNLLQLSEVTGLPQSTVSGRVNDLKTEGKIDYPGYVVYKDRKRKRIIAIKPEIKITQKELF
jgi:aryl-alcohol dehydrogenase-like predicted oxidoreductase